VVICLATVVRNGEIGHLRVPHILLVDDVPGIQTLLADVLRELGYAVDLAATPLVEPSRTGA
jgi:hypothetical protein